MKPFLNVLLSTICAAALLVSCQGKTGEPAPALKGSLVGFVYPVDENGTLINNDKAGVTVTLDNSSPKLTVITGADGKYEFKDVSAGTYNLTYARNGYGGMRRFGVSHVGGAEPTFIGQQGLAQISKTIVRNLSYSPYGYNASDLTFNYGLTGSSNSTSSFGYNYYRLAIYVGTSPDVNSETGTFLTNYYLSSNTNSNSSSGSMSFSRNAFYNLGFNGGTKLYMVAYGAPYVQYFYVDIITGKTIYSGLSPVASPVANFTL